MAWAEVTQRHHTTLNGGKEHVSLGQPSCEPTPAAHGLALVPIELVDKGVARVGMFIKRALAKDVLDACTKEGAHLEDAFHDIHSAQPFALQCAWD